MISSFLSQSNYGKVIQSEGKQEEEKKEPEDAEEDLDTSLQKRYNSEHSPFGSLMHKLSLFHFFFSTHCDDEVRPIEKGRRMNGRERVIERPERRLTCKVLTLVSADRLL